MNSKEQRFAIALKHGAKPYPEHQWEGRDDNRYFICLRCGDIIGWSQYSVGAGETNEPCCGDSRDFCDDLEAMHEIECSLSEWEKPGDKYLGSIQHYRDMLYNVAGKQYFIASASQRAEAYCRMFWPAKFPKQTSH